MGKLEILLVLIVVLIITSAINQSMVKKDQDKKPQDKSLEKLAKPTPTASPTPTPEDTQTNNEDLQVYQTPDSTSTIEYVYPGSTVIKTEGSTLFLQSSADPTTITNWYVDQIEKAGFSAKSTVRTNTNGNILNKISASSSGQKIEIEIKRTPNSSIA